MVLGRLTHYAFDALAISTVLAGIKKQTGFGLALFPLPSISLHCLPTRLLTLNKSARYHDSASKADT